MKRLGIFILLFISVAFARVNFEQQSFDVASFKDYDKLTEICNAPAASSFWCDYLDSQLNFISTKSVDYFYSESGELLAVFIKQQKGQNLETKDGGYKPALDSKQNLIPINATVPAGAVLIDGEFNKGELLSSAWSELNDTEFEGKFKLLIDGIEVEKTIIVSNVKNTVKVNLAAKRLSQSDATNIQYVVAGIGKANPIIKIGQGETSSLNPIPTAVKNPAYISAQTANNKGDALILRPQLADAELEAISLGSGLIAMQKPLATEIGSSLNMSLDQYSGKNELVRYFQEAYKDLPGLFKPNIFGLLSLYILQALLAIHGLVNSWGLSIIILTLFFRALIWPLIAQQTKSMFAMQRLKPKIDAIQKKYKDDKQKQSQATMELYKKEGVNPAGGCLPMVVQMPLFIILWRVFANFEFNEGFLWIPDLGQSDPLYILPALYLLVMFAQSYFMSQGNKSNLKQQLLMNSVFIFIIVGFPTGVTLYYVVSMLVQVIQQFLLNRNKPDKLVTAK